MKKDEVDLGQILQQCVNCGKCRAYCPSFEAEEREPFSARGRALLMNGFETGEVEMSNRLQDILDSCLLCHSCTAECPADVEIDLAVLHLRQKMMAQGGTDQMGRRLWRQVLRPTFGRPGSFRRLMGWLRCGLPAASALGLVQNRQVKVAGKAVPLPADQSFFEHLEGLSQSEQAGNFTFRKVEPETGSDRGREVFMFLGCLTNDVYPEAGRAAVRLLAQQGYRVYLSPAEMCCGLPLSGLGDLEGLRRAIEHNLSMWVALKERNEIDDLVMLTPCASCAATLAHYYPRLAAPTWQDRAQAMAENTHTVTGFLSQKPAFRAQLQATNRAVAPEDQLPITFHAPCHLRNHDQLAFSGTRLLDELEGVEYVSHEEENSCCGFAGSFSLKNPRRSRLINEKKMTKLASCGANRVATNCPGCMFQLGDGIARQNLPLKTRHIAEIIWEQMEELDSEDPVAQASNN